MRYALLFILAVIAISGANSSSNADERPIAIIRRAKPDLWIKHGKGQWKSATVAEQLFSGDSIKTGADGYAAVQFMDNSLVKIKPNSILAIFGEVRGKDNAASRLAVQVGDVFLNVTKQKSDFEIGTPSAVAAVKGTKGNVSVDDKENTQVDVIEGIFEVKSTSTGETGLFRKGQTAIVNKENGSLQKRNLTQQQQQQINNSYNELDQKSKPKTLKLRFINKAGEVQEAEVEYFENERN
jgi:hypothetical protein